MKKTVLVVEDSRVLRTLYTYALTAEGFDVLEAENGAAALARLHNPVDLVLTDLCMPHMDGVEFARRLRSLADHHNTPIVMLSGEADQNRILEAQNAGVDRFLHKPIDFERLIAALGALLGDPETRTRPDRFLCAA